MHARCRARKAHHITTPHLSHATPCCLTPCHAVGDGGSDWKNYLNHSEEVKVEKDMLKKYLLRKESLVVYRNTELMEETKDWYLRILATELSVSIITLTELTFR